MPSNMMVKDGRVWLKGKGYDNEYSDYPVEWIPQDTPEEADVFRVMGLKWVEPRDRK